MDIKVRLSSGELVDLEMQVHHLSDYINRSVFYMGKLIKDSLEIGEDYDIMSAPCDWQALAQSEQWCNRYRKT